MTVKDLIKRLNKLDPNATILWAKPNYRYDDPQVLDDRELIGTFYEPVTSVVVTDKGIALS